MPLEIRRYTAEAVPAVREFNARLLAGGAPEDQQFPETPDPGWMPGMELYLARENDTVRGGYILRRQQFTVGGSEVSAGHYRLPLSEGIVDRAHAMLGLRLVRDALAREPRLYAMGMGGWDKPLPRMLKSLKWRMCAVPFHFLVVHPARFLRHIRRAAHQRVAARRHGRGGVHGRGLAGHEGAGHGAASAARGVRTGAGASLGGPTRCGSARWPTTRWWRGAMRRRSTRCIRRATRAS